MRRAIAPSFPDYYVYSDGTVERRRASKTYKKAGDIAIGRVLLSGYRQHKLVHADGTRRAVRANRLVCEAFHGTAPSPQHQAAHKNGDRLDNREDNLYWATPKENKQDANRHGTTARGHRIGIAKLTDDAVVCIREQYTGRRGDIARLARVHGVGPACIYNVVNRLTWQHVPERSALYQKMQREA